MRDQRQRRLLRLARQGGGQRGAHRRLRGQEVQEGRRPARAVGEGGQRRLRPRRRPPAPDPQRSAAHCATYAGKTEKFAGAQEVRRDPRRLVLGRRQAGLVSYLLPAQLGRGRYVLDVQVTDKAGNTTTSLDSRQARAWCSSLPSWSRAHGRALATAFAALVAAAVVAGCGLGAGPTASETELLVSKDFGAEPIVQTDQPKIGGSDTVMRLLQRNAPKVTTRFGGNFVQSIDGVSGGRSDGEPGRLVLLRQRGRGRQGRDRDQGPRRRSRLVGLPRLGRHRWTSRPSSARSPSRSCTGSTASGCRRASSAPSRRATPACAVGRTSSSDLGHVAARGGVGTSVAVDTLRILVGPWRALRAESHGQAAGTRPGRRAACTPSPRPTGEVDRACSTPPATSRARSARAPA